MKKIKIFFFVGLAGLFAALFFQNKELFMTKKNIALNLLFVELQTPDIPMLYIFSAFFVFGFFVASFFVFTKLIKYKKIIRHLNSKVHRDKTENSKKIENKN